MLSRSTNQADSHHCPFPPADSLDIMSRLIGPKITERLGQTIVVDNRAGAAGQLGLDLAARAAHDGYTLVGGQGGNLVVQPHTYKKLPYDPFKDFAPVALSTTNYLALVVNPAGQFKSLQDLISYGKANPPHPRSSTLRHPESSRRMAFRVKKRMTSGNVSRKSFRAVVGMTPEQVVDRV